MEYLLKASGIVILLFLFYYIFLKNETFFKSIRGYFLVGLLIVVSMPLIEIPVYIEIVTTQLNTFEFQDISTAQNIETTKIDWEQILTFIYLIGVALFSMKFLIQFFSLFFLLSKHRVVKQGAYYYVETSKNVSPFSFFTIIIYNKSHFSIDELEQILNHEKAHVLQWHSIDTILAHLLVITLWFNPFVWFYRKAVQQNLEFLADAYAIELANNQKHYQLTLLKTCSATFCTELTNNFYNSLIKKRIVMIHRNRSKNNSQWKYTLIIPLLLAFVFTFNTNVIAQEKDVNEVEETTEINIELTVLVLDKNTTDEGLDKMKQDFKENADITLTFKGIKRNSDKEITAIKIEAKGKESSANFATNSSKPIKPIKISYDSESNAISIGNVNGLHKEHYTYTIHEKDGNHFIEKKDHDENYVIITSDGEKATWTEKANKDKYVKLKMLGKKGDHGNHTIIKKGKGENIKVEVIEEIGGEHKVKVIEEIHEIVGDEGIHDIKVTEGKKGEKVITIRKFGDKDAKHIKRKKGDFKFMTDKGDKPLFVIDGKESTYKEMEAMDPDSLAKIEVLKGDKAIEKYGEKAKDGVVLITTKKDIDNTVRKTGDKDAKHIKRKKGDFKFMTDGGDKPLFVIDGKESTHKEMEAINPDNIAKIEVLKGDKAIEKYGEKAKVGVILITTIKE